MSAPYEPILAMPQSPEMVSDTAIAQTPSVESGPPVTHQSPEGDLPEHDFEYSVSVDSLFDNPESAELQFSDVEPREIQASFSDAAQSEPTPAISLTDLPHNPMSDQDQQLPDTRSNYEAAEIDADANIESGNLCKKSSQLDIDVLFGDASQPQDLETASSAHCEQTELSTSKDPEFQAWWEGIGASDGQLVFPNPLAASTDWQPNAEGVDVDLLPMLNHPAPQRVVDSGILERTAENGRSIIDPALEQSILTAVEPENDDAASDTILSAQEQPLDVPIPTMVQHPLQLPTTSRCPLPSSPPTQMPFENVRIGPGPLQWFAVRREEGPEEIEGQDDTHSEPEEDEDPEDMADWTPYPAHPRPAAWGPHQSEIPVFKYSTRGQWSVGSYFSTEALRFYVSQCPRNLTIWLQANPRSHQRHDEWDRMCRWSECPDKGHPIRPGFYRCTFDEYSHLTTQEKKDPFFVAGCMHLYCFEQVFDVAKLHRRGRLIPDERVFELEGKKNPMKIDRPPDTAIIDSAFYRWISAQPDTQNIPAHRWMPRAHEQSLSYAMTQFHVSRHSPGRLKMCEDDDGNDKAEILPMTAHLGNLQLFIDSVKAQKEYKRVNPIASAPKRRKLNPSKRRDSVSSLTSLDTYQTEDDSDEESGVYVIDQILGSRRRNGKTEYEVKWRGHKTPTWEARASLRQDLSSAEIELLISGHSSTERKQTDGRFKAMEQKIDGLLEVIQRQQRELNTRKRGRDALPDSDSEDEVPAKRKRIIKPTKTRTARRSVLVESDESQDESDGSEYNPKKRKCAQNPGSFSNKRRKFVVG